MPPSADPLVDTVDHLDTLISQSFGEGSDLKNAVPGASLAEPEPPSTEPEGGAPATPSGEPAPSGDAEPDGSGGSPAPEGELEGSEEDLDSKFPDLSESGTTPQAKARWGDLKSEARTAKAEAKALRAKVAELEAKLSEAPQAPAGDSASADLITQLQEQVSAKERELSAYRVESTELYAQQVRAPLAKLAAEAEQIGGEALLSALSVTDPRERSRAISEAVEDLPELDRLTAYNLVRELDQVFERQRQLRANSQEAMQELERHRAAEQAAQRAKQTAEMKKAGEEAWTTFTKKLPFLRDEKGLVKPEFSSVRDEGLATDLLEKPPLVRAYSVYAGLLLPKVLDQLRGAQSQINNLQEVIATFEKSTPGGASGPGGSEAPATPDDSGEFGDFLDRQFSTGSVKFG
jgi:hypothetical protein